VLSCTFSLIGCRDSEC